MNYDFSIQDNKSLQNSEDYITIICGKGKKDDNAISIKAVEFSYVEGLIWDKYREYGSKVKTKISVADWARIVAGFKECSTRLSTYTATDDLKEILQFNLYRTKSPIADIESHVAELNEAIIGIGAWLESNIQNEKTISIMKHKSQL